MSKISQSDKKQIILRLSPELHEQIKNISDKELRSLNAQIEYILIKFIEDYEKTNN